MFSKAILLFIIVPLSLAIGKLWLKEIKLLNRAIQN